MNLPFTFPFRTGVGKFTYAVVLAAWFVGQLSAGTVRLSFLREESVVRDTARLLRDAGCSKEGVVAFTNCVAAYFATRFPLDTSKLPHPEAGYFVAQSADSFLTALPQRLCDLEHPYGIACFETVILLGAPALRVKLSPDAPAGILLFTRMETNTPTWHWRATARDFFDYKQPPWYLEQVGRIMPASQTNAWICLTAALARNHLLPMSTREENLKATMLETLKVAWRQFGLVFSSRFEVVVCYQVNLPWHCFGATHTGLLIPNRKHYTYLEKCGGSGPFVRLDFEETPDLLKWLVHDYRPETNTTHVFATFNDKRIVQLPVSFKKE